MRLIRGSFIFLLSAVAFRCSDSANTPVTSTDTVDASSSGGTDSASVDCSGATTNYAQVVCAAHAFLATLTSAEQATVVYDWSNSAAKTVWSNLPNVTRNGMKFGAMSATSRAAALALAKVVLTTQGYGHLVGVYA